MRQPFHFANLQVDKLVTLKRVNTLHVNKKEAKMRTIIISLLLIFGSAYSQVITTEPSFATVNDSIVIIFDATKGDQGLMGYTGKVYTHTGATINGTRWQHVIGNWGDDNAQPELTRIDTDLYKLVIGKPHTFYSVNQCVLITKLMLIHSAVRHVFIFDVPVYNVHQCVLKNNDYL